MQLREMTLEVDTHTHTILSGHAWSTLRENCCAARGRGMKGLCLTEHAPGIEGGAPSFIPHSQRMLPQEVEGIRVYQGIPLLLYLFLLHFCLHLSHLRPLDLGRRLAQ